MTLKNLKMLELKVYRKENMQDWDSLIKRSKNGTFLFLRSYMDYHSHRFSDLSFMIYRNGKIEGVLPGNIANKIYYSHQGLSYGGLVLTEKISVSEVLIIFELLNKELRNRGVEKVIYKPIPYIYHKMPSQEDIYALFKMGAIKIACNISSTIYQRNKLNFIESRKSGIRKSKKFNVEFIESNRFDLFWPILNENLTNKYEKNAVHSLEEISYLHDQFPNSIKLYLASINQRIVAGTVLYLMDNVIHVQYISANEEGKSTGALDMIFDKLINDIYKEYPIFDFGQSTEDNGYYLNENLIFQKEGFGGRGVVFDSYEFLV